MGAAAAKFGRDTPALVKAVIGGGCGGHADPQLVAQLAAKWGPIHGCPVETIRVIAKIESGYRLECVAMYGGAIPRGGAWGLMQQTLSTAKGNVLKLRKSGNAAVQAAISRFDGTGTSLFDPDLNVCLGAYQLGRLTAEFSDFTTVVAAYHQGAGKIRRMRNAGKAINPQTLLASGAPKGAVYVTRALQARSQIA